MEPICIFKGKRMKRGEQIPSGVVVWFQENGWMNSDLMIKYIDYFNCIRSKFRGHLEASVKAKFNGSNIGLAAGSISLCQPLDIAINKPFEDNLCKEWHL
jgi:hypothetical protein